FPPVVVAHSLGGLVAQKAAEAEAISALVLLSCPPPRRLQPAAARSVRLLRLKYALLMALGRPFRLEEKDFRRLWFSALPEAEQVDLSRRMIPESVHLIRDFLDRDIDLHSNRIRCPVLVLGGSEDPVVPAANLRGLAQSLGGDFNVYPGHGHWILGEGEGEAIVRDIHRWVVQKLGDEILLAEFSGEE
ncbi:MAG: alpha/beta hydrolase, partial [Deltaproteobacteria bacterium]|nr:alpha/beta hydrolase [Deltaproteobacteria bacterium]